MQKVLSYIINSNQTSFSKDRPISQHIRSIDDIIHLTSVHNEPGMIISLEFARAFDSVEKETILAALEQFNFGPNFIQMIKTSNANTKSCVQTDMGYLRGSIQSRELNRDVASVRCC